MGGHDGRRPAHRSGGVHPHHGLAHRPEGRGQVELGHHDALEHVRRLADDHGVDVATSPSRRPRGPGWPPRGRARRWRRPRAWPRAGSGPTPITAQRSAITPPFASAAGGLGGQGTDQVLLQTRPRGGVGQAPVDAVPSMIRSAASPMRTSPATMRPLAARAPPDGLTATASARPERVAQDQLLVGEGGVELGHVDGPPGSLPSAPKTPGTLGRQAGRGGCRQVARPEGVGLDAVVHARDPRRPFAQLGGPVPGGQHDGGGPVGDGRQGVAPQRGDHVVVGQQLLDGAGPRSPGRSGWPGRRAGCGRPRRRSRASVACPASIRACACRAARATGSGHSGAM